MKKKLLFSILGMATASTFAQQSGITTGVIQLDNYNSLFIPLVTYGAGIPANGVSGPLGTPGAGLNHNWTAGIYFVVGTPSITDPSSSGIPSALLSLGTGSGSTAQFQPFPFTGFEGTFISSAAFNTGGTVGDMITAEIVAYDTADGSYAAAHYRAHSAPFTMPTASITTPFSGQCFVGDYMTAFQIQAVPEPVTSVLVGIGIIGISVNHIKTRLTRRS